MTNVDRALLFSEWSAGGARADVCPLCGATQPFGHYANCSLDLALSERGYCTQEERDRARAQETP